MSAFCHSAAGADGGFNGVFESDPGLVEGGNLGSDPPGIGGGPEYVTAVCRLKQLARVAPKEVVFVLIKIGRRASFD